LYSEKFERNDECYRFVQRDVVAVSQAIAATSIQQCASH